MLEQITFALAFAGYTGLTATAVAAARGRLPVRFWQAVAGVIFLHVVLVWAVRYEWDFDVAVRNGYAGFVLFHTALALIVMSVFASDRPARALILVAFATVTAGAVGAVFRYDVVALYRVPVILCAIIGVLGLVRTISAVDRTRPFRSHS